MKIRGKCVIIHIKQKGVMTYYNANTYISSAMADLETTFLLYLYFSCIFPLFSERLRYAWVHPRECRYAKAV